MRFDSIDLIGEFRINGLTGNSGQAIGFSGSNIEWIEASSGGVSADTLPRTGYSYIIVGATGSPSENGQALIDAYAELQTLTNPSFGVNNRMSLLLMPGQYDLPTQLSMASFYDIHGISSNPYDTVVSGNPVLISGAGVDFAISNVRLTTTNYILNSGQQDYLRFKNVVIGGNGFYNGGYGNSYLTGEFEDIVIEDSAYFGSANSIEGVFKNIQAGSVSEIFNASSGNLSGTFSDIKISNISGYCFNSPGSISGHFRNINVFNSTGNPVIFDAGNDLTGDYKNIRLPNTDYAFRSSSGNVGSNSSRFEDISIGDAEYCFFGTVDIAGGHFKNITIGSVLFDSFCGSGGSIYGVDVQNVKVHKTGNFFKSAASVEGTFKDLILGSCSDVFYAITNLQGTFSNIKIDSSNYLLVGDDNLIIDLENLKCETVNGGYSFHGYTVGNYSNLRNVELGYVKSGYTFGSRNGETSLTVDNLKINRVDGLLFPASSIGSFTTSNIEIDRVGNSVFQATDLTLDCVNLEIRRVDGNFIDSSSSHNIGRIQNIKIDSPNAKAFNLLGANPNPNQFYNEINLGNVSGNCFYKSSDLTGIYKNIKIGNVGGELLIATGSNSNIAVDIDNFKVGNVTGEVLRSHFNFSSNQNQIVGIFKNLEVSSCREIFRADALNGRIANALFENIIIGTCSRAFYSRLQSSVTIRNLQMTGIIYSQTFTYTLENSSISARDRNTDPVYGFPTNLHRSKLISNISSGVFSNLFYPYTAYLCSFNGGTVSHNFTGSSSNIFDPDVSF